LEDLKKYSPFTYFWERVFFGLQYLSPANLFFRTRVDTQKEFNDTGNSEGITVKRGRRIEAYVMIWAVLLIACAVVGPQTSGCLRCLCIFLPSFRVFEILQLAINMNIFDRIRLGERKHYVSGVTRTLVLSLWNFLELILCFSIIYSVMLKYIKNAETVCDAYYFSVITQLTIGYGDLSPLGPLRFVAPFQGVVGFLFGLFVLTRFIAFLPQINTIQEDGK